MKNYPVSLERAFLRRQFRSIRQYLVGKPIQQGQALARKAVALIPTHFHSKERVAQIIFEQKSTFVSLNKHIDTDRVFVPLKSDEIVTLPTPQVFNTESDFYKPVSATKVTDSARNPKKNKFQRIFQGKVRAFVLGGIILACIAVLVVLFAPTVYYTLNPGDVIPIETDASGTPLGGNFSSGSARVSSHVAAPTYDEHLPDGNWLIIPKIGVNTEILESATPDESLNKGVWRVPDFGTVTDLSKPMILAAHRYGWKAWWENGNQYWRYHSFYMLPKLEQGDIIEVISDHRKYVYEVYAGEQGQEISDYNADLILYTCKFLDSPLRYFRYARLVDPNNPKALSSK